MNIISQYIKSIGGIQQESWNFYYGPTGIDKITRAQGGIQNLTIDYSTDTNGRILSATYTETGGYSGELFTVYDNFGNMTGLVNSTGNSVRAVILDPNNASITQYNPQGIDDPHSYRAREGFIGINDLWADNSGTVYLQGHPVIPNDWGNVFTNGTTTTTTDDTTAKGGGDEEEKCDPCDPETLGTGGRRGGLTDDAWFRNLNGLYNGIPGRTGWKYMNCEQLNRERNSYMNSWLSMSRLGFGGNYSDYDVWDDLEYLISISKLFTPSERISYLRAFDDQKWRLTISALQVLDCLIKEKC